LYPSRVASALSACPCSSGIVKTIRVVFIRAE
jgi:hypothetical protein